jgi:hypothetical protein
MDRDFGNKVDKRLENYFNGIEGGEKRQNYTLDEEKPFGETSRFGINESPYQGRQSSAKKVSFSESQLPKAEDEELASTFKKMRGLKVDMFHNTSQELDHKSFNLIS